MSNVRLDTQELAPVGRCKIKKGGDKMSPPRYCMQ